jgi:hypothetical protein
MADLEDEFPPSPGSPVVTVRTVIASQMLEINVITLQSNATFPTQTWRWPSMSVNIIERIGLKYNCLAASVRRSCQTEPQLQTSIRCSTRDHP